MDALSERDQEDLELGRFFRKLLHDDQPSTWIDVQAEPGFPWLVMDLRVAPTEAEAALIARVITNEGAP